MRNNRAVTLSCPRSFLAVIGSLLSAVSVIRNREQMRIAYYNRSSSPFDVSSSESARALIHLEDTSRELF